MRPGEPRETNKQDLFRSRIDQIIDLNYALVRLSQAIDCYFLERRFGSVYTDCHGSPPQPTRLMAGLAIFKHMHDLSDDTWCDRWPKVTVVVHTSHMSSTQTVKALISAPLRESSRESRMNESARDKRRRARPEVVVCIVIEEQQR